MLVLYVMSTVVALQPGPVVHSGKGSVQGFVLNGAFNINWHRTGELLVTDAPLQRRDHAISRDSTLLACFSRGVH